MFNEVKDPVLRAWDRLNTIYNMKEQHGNVVATRYAGQLSREDLISVHILIASVEAKGYEQTRRDIYRDVVNA